MARNNGTPPPGNMPSSTAARVCVKRVVHPIFLLLDLDLGRAADADHRDTARELGQRHLQR
jgi:hypothetical protein